MCENDCVSYRTKCNERKSKKTAACDEFYKRLNRRPLPRFTCNEIAVHNSPDDFWVSILGIVRDLTPLVHRYQGTLEIRPILAFAGKDLSHWFDPRTGDILHHVHPVTGVLVPYSPHGPLVDVQSTRPSVDWTPLDHPPWWLDITYVIGLVTDNARPIRVMNVLTQETVTMEVCSEDTLDRIQERYLQFNSHAQSYTWKYEGRVLDMELTLGQNQVPDPRSKFKLVNMPERAFVPCLMAYFNDDLT